VSETIEVEGATFNRCMGATEVCGRGGPLFTYTVFVQQGLGLQRDKVAAMIDRTLADPRGWTRGGGVRFQRVERNASTYVYLAKPHTVDRLCAPLQTDGQVSCSIGQRVVFNHDRWMDAVPHWKGSVKTYRQMVICHEFGHRIGQGHRFCTGAGNPAPVMQQQTYGLQGCHENSWPLTSELP